MDKIKEAVDTTKDMLNIGCPEYKQAEAAITKAKELKEK